MGKYMHKVKASSEEAIAMPLGVCTHAQTLVLQKQRLQSQGKQGEGVIKEYLELRSRKLEKVPPQKASMKRGYRRKMGEKGEGEAPSGENNLMLEKMARRASRDITPCNSITVSEIINMRPGRSRRPNPSTCHDMVQAPLHYTTLNLDKLTELFAAQTQRDQQAFMDKYNFDPVNDCPLPGHYEWVKLK